MTQSDETVHCSICGADEQLHYNEETNQQLRTHQMCFMCNFWRSKVAMVNNPKSARIEGRHYWVEPMVKDGTPRHWLGFGGSPFTVRFHDGREVKTNNLWSQGDIPERWRSQLPDNAVFVKE